jgi:hypothetical protein|tara:strand:+ start:443 stop:703 length:261 start_codon:yes stop_codon:yes gene_type:complete
MSSVVGYSPFIIKPIGYRTIFKCIVRLMVLKKRAQTRILARKNLKIENLHRGVGHQEELKGNKRLPYDAEYDWYGEILDPEHGTFW